MKEKLIIKNFGPIKSVELELGRFTILIGNQSTGKSTIAKVFASIKSLLYSTGNGALGLMRQEELSSLTHFKKHLSVYEVGNYLNAHSVISLTGKEINFHLENEIINFNYDELLAQNFLRKNSVTYIPADRIATALFSGSTWADLIDVEEGRIDMPKYFLRFFSLFNRIKKQRTEYDFTDILDIKFKQENGVDKIILGNGDSISINESASAVQSNLSLLTVIDWQSEKRSENIDRTFIIEEPELNLFPTTQNKLIKYLVNRVINNNKSLFLTTHSPYILTSLNNLMYAYNVGNLEGKGVEVKHIINKKYWLNPDYLSAYIILRDGEQEEIEDIMDSEESLIKAEKIDGASTEINKDFNALINIEMGIT